MKNFVKRTYNYLKQAIYLHKIETDSKYLEARNQATIIRLTHSIEKGLCIRETRPGFGIAKIKMIINCINEVVKINKDFIVDTSVQMAYDAISEYIEWNDTIGFHSDEIENIRKWHLNLGTKYVLKVNKLEKMGGTEKIQLKPVDIENIENLFNNRHSSRVFFDQEVPKESILKAIKLAERCPSACNRQATRLYIINHKKKELFSEWLSGTGGFDKEIKEFILVCAKTSAYMPQEYQQYEVSTGIFVGYLTLALQAYGICSCVIQRDVINTKAWRNIADKMDIPYDEQIICILGCGLQDTDYPVPISHRLEVDEITKFK